MANTSVQIEGLAAVVNAYRYKGVPSWAIFYGREMLFECVTDSVDDGADQLEAALGLIETSKATYKLRVFLSADIPSGGHVRSNTPDVGGFNFRLNAEPVAVGYGNGGAIPYEVQKRLDKIEAANQAILDKLAIDEADDGEPGEIGAVGWIETVKQIMGIPGIPELVQGVVAGLLPKGHTVALAGPPSDALQPVPDDFEAKQAAPDQERMERALRAYLMIEADLPEAVELLEQLATVAQNKPGTLAKMVPLVKTFLV